MKYFFSSFRPVIMCSYPLLLAVLTWCSHLVDMEIRTSRLLCWQLPERHFRFKTACRHFYFLHTLEVPPYSSNFKPSNMSLKKCIVLFLSISAFPFASALPSLQPRNLPSGVQTGTGTFYTLSHSRFLILNYNKPPFSTVSLVFFVV